MKKIYILIASFACCATTVFGQAELHQKGDTLGVSNNGRELITITDNEGNFSLSAGGFSISLEGNNKKTNHSTTGSKPAKSIAMRNIQFGFIGLTTPDYSIYDHNTMEFMSLNNGKSISFSFTISTRYPLGRSAKAWLSAGVRPRWDNYVFDQRITIEKYGGMVQPIDLSGMRRFKKSKLTTLSLDIPITLEVRPARKVSVNAGVYGGLTLKGHTKVKFPKDKDKGSFGVNFFNAGLILQVKYRAVGIFADYSLTPLFKNGVGPKTNPFTIGIVFM